MSLFTENMPEWNNTGAEPPTQKKTDGWLPTEKPPADWFNWLFNRGYKSISEIRDIIDGINDDMIDKFPNNAGAHNAIYRGKNLGSVVTTAQASAISSGTFEDLYIGDYWEIDGRTYRIAAFNYYRRAGDTGELTTNHVTLVPDDNLYTHVMNDTNTTTGGYTGSKMYGEGLDQAKATINNAFTGRVLTHRQLLCNATANGKASGFAWFDSQVELMNEVMAYGSSVFGDSNLGGSGGFNIGGGKSQLPLFSYRPDIISNRQTFYLRDVVSSSRFALVLNNGAASEFSASTALGVRPAFSIS